PPFARPSPIESTQVSARGATGRATGAGDAALDEILAELRTLREGQEELLELMRGRASRVESQQLFQEPALHHSMDTDSGDDAAAPSPPPVVRSRRRKTAVLMDDDAAVRAETQAALEK